MINVQNLIQSGKSFNSLTEDEKRDLRKNRTAKCIKCDFNTALNIVEKNLMQIKKAVDDFGIAEVSSLLELEESELTTIYNEFKDVVEKLNPNKKFCNLND